MLAILSITAPIFILIGLGYVCVLSRLVAQDTTRAMGQFVITIALPAMIVRGMANKPLAASLEVNFLMGYALASLILFGAGTALYRRLRSASLAESSVAGMGMSSSNSGFVGVSVCAMVLGTDTAARAVAMTILVESALVIPLMMAIADASLKQGEGHLISHLAGTLKRLLRSPLVIAIFLGLFLAAFRIPVPGVAMTVIDMLAVSAAPVALFAVGGNLHGLRPRGMLGDAASVSFVKLVIHPALTALVFLLFPGLDPVMRQAGILFAAAPMLSIYPILGMRYGQEERCSATLLLATVASFLTISATIALIR